MLSTTTGLLPRPTAQAQIDASYVPALVIFGKDENGRAHASSFAEGDVALATKAASLMGMRLLPVQIDDEQALELAARVSRGKVFVSGRGFVPFVKASLFAAIEAIASANNASSSSESQPSAQAGNAVNEIDTANIIEAAKLLVETTPIVPQPTGWGDIQVGSIVLSSAQPGEMDWYECLVVNVEAENHYELRYCDWPQEPSFTNDIADIALLHPSRQPEPPLEADQLTVAA